MKSLFNLTSEKQASLIFLVPVSNLKHISLQVSSSVHFPALTVGKILILHVTGIETPWTRAVRIWNTSSQNKTLKHFKCYILIYQDTDENFEKIQQPFKQLTFLIFSGSFRRAAPIPP